MSPFTNKGKSKRPKFLLDFQIHELTNIPQSAGICYVKWSLKDGTGSHGQRKKKITVESVDAFCSTYNNDDPSNQGSGIRTTITGSSSQKLGSKSHGIKAGSPLKSQIGSGLMSRNGSRILSTGSAETSVSACESIVNTTTVEATNQSKGYTSRLPVNNHKCEWDYELNKPVLVKLNVKKNRALEDKILVLECYFEFLDDSKHSNRLNLINVNRLGTDGLLNVSTLEAEYRSAIFGNSRHSLNFHRRTGSFASETSLASTNSTESTKSSAISSSSNASTSDGVKTYGKILLGTVSVNIAEYVSPQEVSQTNRFLLQKSKVNSILSFSCNMRLIRGSYQDFELPMTFSSGQFPNSLKQLGDTYNPNCTNSIPLANTELGSNASLPAKISRDIQLNKELEKSNLESDAVQGMQKNRYKHMGACSIQNVRYQLTNPLVELLYEKTYQIPWDRKPYELDPKKCVDNILTGGDGWAGSLDKPHRPNSYPKSLIQFMGSRYSGSSSNADSEMSENSAKRFSNKEYHSNGNNSSGSDQSFSSENKSIETRNNRLQGYKVNDGNSSLSLVSTEDSLKWEMGGHADEDLGETDVLYTEKDVAQSSFSDFDEMEGDYDDKNQRYLYIDKVKNTVKNELLETKTWSIHKYLD